MHVRMLSNQEESVNGGRTSQRFEAGQSYDVPDGLAARWCEAQPPMAVAIGGSAPSTEEA